MRRVAILLVLAFVTPAAARQLPPRDPVRRPAPVVTSTATITGRVWIDELQPKPLRRARVTASGTALPGGRTVITNDDGSYRIEGLPAGRYFVRAVKDGYVAMSFGARRTTVTGAWLVLRERETRSGVDIRLARGSVLSGLITDQDGQPMIGITVTALARRYIAAFGDFKFVPGGTSVATDDRGEYRIFGLPAGQYIIAATPRDGPQQDLEVLSDAEIRRAMDEARQAASPFRSRPGIQTAPPPVSGGPPEPRRAVTFAPTYFPGTTRGAQALPIAVGVSEERSGLDFIVDAVPTGGVRGYVMMPDAGDAPIDLFLMSPQSMVLTENLRAARVRSGSAFSFNRLAPGTYTIVAQPRASGEGAAPPATWARADVAIDGEVVEGVFLVGQPNLALEGRIVFEGSTRPPALATRVRLPLTSMLGGPVATAPFVSVGEDGRIAMSVAPGTYRLPAQTPGIRQPAGRWFLKSITVDGSELLDSPIDLRANSSNMTVTFTDQASEVTGHVVAPSGVASPDAYVVAFSTARDAWFPGSRRVAGVRVADDGTYAIRNLPAGEYFAVVVSDLEDGEWNDPELLDRLSRGATRVTVKDAGKQLLDLRAPAAPSGR